jgi:hypothetical protein
MKTILLVLPIILTGCATYNETFDCEPGKGVGCTSLSQVNHMVDEKKLPLGEEEPVAPIKTVSSQKKLRIWIAGHTDEEGITHEPSIVHVPLGETTP